MSKAGDKPSKLRKTPRQERSQRTRQDLLAGATRVLERAGADAFTTNRVAEAAGVSIGSLYQYYPSGGALLADLHAQDTERLWTELSQALRDEAHPARDRFERVIVASLLAQNGAVAHHRALERAGEAGSDLPELLGLEVQAAAEFELFLRSALPERGQEAAELALFCVETLMATLARLAHKPWPEADAQAFAQRTAAMLAEHLRL
jgi:AcrR family transcriptional regulator